MKLINLFEKFATARQVKETNLIMYVSDGSGTDIYIISDIPPITEKEFEQLHSVSFPDASTGDLYIDAMNASDDPSRNEWMYGLKGEQIEIITWKEFIAKIYRDWVDDDDDFSE